MSAADLAARLLDLDRAPFTLPSSRIMVFRRGEDAVSVHTSEYERSRDECRVLQSLSVHDGAGAALPITAVRVDRIEFGGGAATLTFDGAGALSLRGGAGIVAVTEAGERVEHDGSAGLRIAIGTDRSLRLSAADAHDAALAATQAAWDGWFAKLPVVRDDLQEMAAFCWWVLGANIVEIPSMPGSRAVVPSKIGYVGAWQWDAYFIARGLRHGDPVLAREQLDIVFAFPTPTGQLPDVVHEHGVLASSDDLPEGDRENLRRAGSAIADPTAPVPLTKPPLAAWAVRAVLEAEDDPQWARRVLPVVAASQEWWLRDSDLDHDGLPEYGHPYSSGLDDSPVFDGPIPTTAPDLAAYLVQQDRELADLWDRYAPEAADTEELRRRADRTAERLLRLWDPQLRRFVAWGAGEPIVSDTVVGLIPLFTGTLPEAVVSELVAAIEDPARYAAPWVIPTVALSDPDYSPTRMWRGPVWVNTTLLVAEGLERSGRAELAREIRERIAALVIHAGGPHEYFNPETGEKAPRATTAFAWSAALFIDNAVALTGR
ncbi:amylo-alpha-1,6-glucosidase [Microbacterium sp. GXS0129]|uniref:amylo-alpha-1,6-glucosidase n=1 Tax=Microbacterium sp. GXS0129 TaxID=3377836 RepID=UPI00383AA3AF